MFGCLRRIGCLAVIALVVAAYFARDLWYDRARALVRRDAPVTRDSAVGTWEALSPERAERGERAVRNLARSGGPVYVTLRAGELASYAFLSLASTLPPSAEGAQAAVIGDRVYVRAVVSLRDLGGGGALDALGPLGGLLAERDTLRLGGTFDVLRSGLAQFHVRDVQLGSFPLPQAAIPALVRRVRRGPTPAGIADDALAVPVPEYIADVRVTNGRIALYKNVR